MTLYQGLMHTALKPHTPEGLDLYRKRHSDILILSADDHIIYRINPVSDNVRKIEISVVFLKIGEIDTIKEQFSADLIVKSRWREPTLDRPVADIKNSNDSNIPHVDTEHIWNPRLYVENTIGEPKESIYRNAIWNEKGEAFMTEKRRVKGVFLENLELGDFPFDVQDLTCAVASDRPSTEVELCNDPSDLHRVNKQSFVDEQEWYLYKHIESEKMTLTYEYADPTYLRQALYVRCRAARRPAYFFWNIFLITFLICSLCFATFAVKRSLPQNRLQLSFTLVLTSVAFKFVVNQSLPKISYLTYLDKYVLASMIMLAVVCVWHSIVTIFDDGFDDQSVQVLSVVLLANSQRDTTADPTNTTRLEARLEHEAFMEQVERGVLGFLMSFYAAYNLFFVFRIYTCACKRRRIMVQKDKEYMEKVKKQVTKRKFFRRQTTHEVPPYDPQLANNADATWL